MKINYIDIYEYISKYYPIGISEFDSQYFEYKGYNLLQELVYSKLEHFQHNEWKDFVEKAIKEHSQPLKADGVSPMPDPSYTGSLLLLQEKTRNVIYSRKIVFHLSVIGPFYTIYGLDSIVIEDKIDQVLSFKPILYVSPCNIYESWFLLIRHQFEEVYPMHRFLPYSLLKERVKSLSVAGANVKNDQDASIFQALFTSEDVTNYKIKGNDFYE